MRTTSATELLIILCVLMMSVILLSVPGLSQGRDTAPSANVEPGSRGSSITISSPSRTAQTSYVRQRSMASGNYSQPAQTFKIVPTSPGNGGMPTVLNTLGHTFATFSPGTITGGGAAYTKSLDVSGLSGSQYLFYVVTASYVQGTPPHDAYSQTMYMQLSNGGSTSYSPLVTATSGVLPGAGSTTLQWRGIMQAIYTGGSNLTVTFQDTYNDASGPYTSQLQNVTVVIYAAPAPSRTFAAFSPGTMTGGGSAYTKSLDVSGLSGSSYLFYVVSVSYVGGTDAHAAWSSTMNMQMNNGGSTIYSPLNTPTIGALNTYGSSTLQWVGMMYTPYTGGGTLDVSFQDTYNDASGPYTSQLQNATVTIYSAPVPAKTFATFSPGTITGGNAAYTHSLDVSGMPASPYLFYVVTASYVQGTPPHDAYSQTMNMQLSDGSSTAYSLLTTATSGVLPAAGSTTLQWRGLMNNPYTGGGNLTVSFQDTYNDASGPYTSQLQNVSVAVYPAETITYTVSGNAGIAGATLSYTDTAAKTATADGSGNYSFIVSAGWTGSVTPSKTGYSFNPSNKPYSNVLSDQTGQNYSASPTLDAVPQNLVVTDSSNQSITIKWNKNTEGDFTRYRIYRGTSPGPTTKVDSSTASNVDTAKTFSSLAVGTRYYFRVTAVNSFGNESGYSNEVSATPQTTITFVDGSSYVPPASVPNTADNAVGQFKLSAASTGATLNGVIIFFTGSVTGVTGVKLWQSSDNSFGGDTQIGSTKPFASTVTFNSFSSPVAMGDTYYFVTFDLAASSGTITPTIPVNGALIFANGKLSGTITNAPLASAGQPLPVEVSSFTGKSDYSTVTLTWGTKTEASNMGFDVWKRISGSENWVLIASYTSNDNLKGLGTSGTGKIYSFTDNNVSSGVSYDYRIGTVATNGAVGGLKTLTVKVDVPKTYALYQNYPNPFNPSTTIRFDLKKISTVSLGIFNILGEKVLEHNYGTMNAGRYQEDISLGTFPSGAYVYRIEAISMDGQRFVSMKKLVLMK